MIQPYNILKFNINFAPTANSENCTKIDLILIRKYRFIKSRYFEKC